MAHDKAMPTVLQIEGFRFFFYSREDWEPAHIHVESDDKLAKFWLSPVQARCLAALHAPRIG